MMYISYKLFSPKFAISNISITYAYTTLHNIKTCFAHKKYRKETN